MAGVIDALSFERTPDGRRYINYRDLGVQQLGSIYERLLEREIVREDGATAVRPNIFARKDSGSYYTPDDLVGLIIRESIDPPGPGPDGRLCCRDGGIRLKRAFGGPPGRPVEAA